MEEAAAPAADEKNREEQAEKERKGSSFLKGLVRYRQEITRNTRSFPETRVGSLTKLHVHVVAFSVR